MFGSIIFSMLIRTISDFCGCLCCSLISHNQLCSYNSLVFSRFLVSYSLLREITALYFPSPFLYCSLETLSLVLLVYFYSPWNHSPSLIDVHYPENHYPGHFVFLIISVTTVNLVTVSCFVQIASHDFYH